MLLVLGILKWILLIILILFLFLLFLLLLLLFVPFHYEIFGKKEREEKLPRGRGKITYPGLKISGSFQEGNLEYQGKFLLFTLFEGGKEENSEQNEEASQNGEDFPKKEKQVDKGNQEVREDSKNSGKSEASEHLAGLKEEEI